MLVKKWVFENFLYRFDGPLKTLLFYFSFSDFDDILITFAKNFTKRPPICMINIENVYKLLLSLPKIWGLELFDSEMTAL